MRVLVVTGSEHGGTAELGRMVAESLVAHDLPADVGDAAEVDDLGPYEVVIVGGALYNEHWHADARDFVERHADVLAAMPVWLFSSGPLDDSARSGAIAPVDWVRRTAKQLDVRGHMTFGGVLRRENATFFDLLRRRRPGDYRSREQVEDWVRRILTQLPDLPTASNAARGDMWPDDTGLAVLDDPNNSAT